MSIMTLNAYRLLRLIDETRAHMCDEGALPIDGIRFENDGTYLHALATDRYTIAAARAKPRAASEPWSLTIGREDIAWLRRWLNAHQGDELVTLAVEGETINLTSGRGAVTVVAADSFFPKWQNLFRDALVDATASSELVSLDSGFLARWKTSGSHVRVWHTAPEKPLLIVGEDFLGLQMPARYSGTDKDRETVLAEWLGSLGGDTEPGVMPAPLEQFDVPKMAEQLLRHTLHSSRTEFPVDMETRQGRAAFDAWVASSIYGWSAYRLLAALRKADPDLAEATVRDLNEQLESGEIGEWAWDAAIKEGYDPQQWQTEREAWRAKQIEKDAAKKASAAEQPASA